MKHHIKYLNANKQWTYSDGELHCDRVLRRKFQVINGRLSSANVPHEIVIEDNPFRVS